MTSKRKARAIGFNHVSIEVDDLDEALQFYGQFLEFDIQNRSDNAVFIDLGDQFLALTKGRHQTRDIDRHFGLVVDDRELVRSALIDMDVEQAPGPFLGFFDPWGNHVEVISYENIRFTKAPNILRGMGITDLSKNDRALQELAENGMNVD